jgi:hypothetical protein
MNRSSRHGALPRRAVPIVISLLALVAPLSAGQASARPADQVQAPLPAATTVNFLETFDGTPTNPQPWNRVDWDVVQTSRNRESWANPDPMSAHHALANCGDVAAGGNHTVDQWPETVFLCNDHVMTSIDGTPGYAAVYLSPPVMADFTAGSSTIQFDVSTFVSSARDWIDVWISPYGDAISYPSRYDLEVDGSGPPRNGINVVMDAGVAWRIDLVRNGVATTLARMNIPYSGFGGMSRTTRTPVRIVMRSTSMTLSYPTVAGASRTVNFSSLGWTQGVVQFGHHSYTPFKDCESHPFICEPDTWHWDNVRINPARPFYQRQATPERITMVRDSNARSLAFGGAAPANAELWFSGNCNVQVRDTSTSAWRSARVVGVHANHFVEHTQSFRVTVRPGAASIQYRFIANAWYDPGQGCQLSNPIVKSPNTVSAATARPLLTWDAASGSWAVRTMSQWTFTMRSQGTWTAIYDDLVAGDFDRDGQADDYFLSDRATGRWVILSLVGWTPTYRFGGTLSRGYEQFIVGDFDSDGFANDLMLWDNTNGAWSILSFNAFRPTFRRSGSYSTGYNTIVVGDWDSDGRSDDAFIWSTVTGFWVVHSFSGFTGTFRGSGRWSAVYDRAYAGDWDRDRARDDMIVWDDDTGRIVVQSFASFRPTFRRAATFSSTLDFGAAADLDNDGNLNEFFVFDRDARQWQVYRLVGFVPFLARAGTFPVSYDVAWG